MKYIMKTMNQSIVRCICFILVGVLLVAWPEAAILYLVIAIGAMFLIPGLFSVITYLLKKRKIKAKLCYFIVNLYFDFFLLFGIMLK